MNVLVKSIEQDYQNEATRVWFELSGERVAVQNSCGVYALLDSDGYPVEQCNDHDNQLDQLKPAYDKVVNDYCGEDTQIDEVMSL